MTNGIDFSKYSNGIWIVSKAYSHKITLKTSAKEPIVGAYIKPYNKSTNVYGHLFLDLKQFPAQFTLSHFNHEDYKLIITEDSPQQISVIMNPKQINLEAVNLKALYTNSIYINRDNHIQVDIKKMPLLAGQTQQDAFVSLLNLPQISTNVESVAELNIKGGINDQNLVLWNGIRMFQNSHFFGLLSAFNENLVQKISVIDNATPAEFGNALTGTIKLNFDEKIADNNSYGVGINALSSQAFTRLALDENTEFAFAIQRSFTDVFDSPTFQSYTQKAYRDTDLELSEDSDLSDNITREADFYYQDAQFQIKRKFGEKLRINVQGIWFENRLDYRENISIQDTKTSDYNNQNAAIGLDATYSINKSERVFLKSNYSRHASEGMNNTFSGNLDTTQSNTVENYVTQFIWQKQNPNSVFKVGIDFEGSVVFNRFNNTVTEAFLNLGQVSNIYSGFGSYSFRKDKWKFYTGFRTAYFQRDDKLRIEPRFQVDYNLNKNIGVVLRGEAKSQNFKQIIDLDQNFLGIEKRRWVVSGDSISPPLQQTYQVEVMLKWRLNNVGGYASIYNRGLNGISTNDQRFQNEDQFEDILTGDSRIYGVLFHMYFKNKWLNTWLSYAHTDEHLSFGSQEFRGNNNLNHQITWGNHFKYKNWSLSIALNYHTGLPFTPTNTNLPLIELSNRNLINFEHANSGTLPDYFRLDSSLQYRFNTERAGKFKISLGFINLTDKHNLLRKNFRLNRINEQNIQQIDNVGLGFTANLGILWTL
ncbi:TonB-dependent receptor plug domain-containing protein [Psychroflexus maritimus]|uniref:TonB-dependent receptor plug domain-containing protein n=1 Tax=Psychroflexus maritimus TaxID=2714865 RepID=A0A967ACU4_9FLAO|nr:TonB-dependent receptor plug domain-containing protein [Psychroflexus maritimus]NGZ89335.1 TonB-dependent receptor plug domain-containing protein [Psychroflexus maritimus]